MHGHGEFKNCTGGAAGYIDRVVFGESHIYQHPTAKKWYFSELPYDPEGTNVSLNWFTSHKIFLQA